MAITLVQYWQQERDTHEAAQTTAQGDLAIAQLAIATAKTTLDTRVTALEKLTTDIATNRGKLATIAVPSAVTALNQTIRDQIVQQRTLQGAILDDQEAVATAQSDANAANGTLKRVTSRLSDSDAALTAANEAARKRQLLKAQLAAAPFDTIQADATAADAALAPDAKTQIDANFPAALQSIAVKRHATRVARAAQLRQDVIDAEDALGTALSTNGGLAGDAAHKATDFRHAERALTEYATTAKQRYDNAVGTLADLQAIKNGTKTPDLLSAQEKLDAVPTPARTTAETNAEPLDTDRKDVYTARHDLDTQILSQINTDVDKLATDPTVKGKRDAIVAKSATLKAAQDALVTSGDRKALDEWQVVVQDTAWRALIDYYDASAALADLEATVPATLASALDTAENAYAAALAAASKAQRQADALNDVVAQRVERVDASSAALTGRLLSAVRGDSF
ncbi:MAG: hypothetical protein ABI664_02455 [bacterium]